MTALQLFSGSQSIEQTLKAAEIFIKSGLAPKGLKTPESVVVAVAYGAELGLSPMQSLNTIHIIDQKPVVSSNALQALAISRGGQIKTVEHTELTCTLDISRPGLDTHRETFTKADANQQNLLGKDNWQKMPKQMLYARCVSNGLRKVFADVLAGLYSIEEMVDARQESHLAIEAASVEKAAPKTRAKKDPEAPHSKPVVTQSAILNIDVVEPEIVIAVVEPEMPVVEVAAPTEVDLFDRGNPEHLAELSLEYSRHFGAQPTAEQLAQIATWYQNLKRTVGELPVIIKAAAERRRAKTGV